MRLRDNLLYLRQREGVTQEQFAALLGVTRQSVAKWEAGQSTPEIDRLVRMAETFGCTLDDLVSGDLAAGVATNDEDAETGTAASGTEGETPATETGAADPEGTGSTEVAAPEEGRDARPADGEAESQVPAPPTGAGDYDAHVRAFSQGIASGVACIIMGLAGVMLLGAYHYNDALMTLSFIVGVAGGVAFLVPAGIEHAAFARAHPRVAGAYTKAQLDAVRRAFARDLTCGIVLVLGGICAAVAGEVADLADLGAAAMLALVAAGVWLIIRGSMRQGLAVAGTYGGGGEDERPANKEGERVEAACGIVMLVATAVGLLLLFCGHGLAHAYFWLAWPIGGIACGVVGLASRIADRA